MDKLVWIKWVDSIGYSKWTNEDYLKEEFEKDILCCESVGWVIKEDKDRIMIAPHKSLNTNSFDGTMTIPKCSIKEIQEIKD